MRPERKPWLWTVAAALVGALLPGIFLSIDPHAHFPWQVAWMMIAPVTALIAALVWAGGGYIFRRLQR